jgi:hypothetical protein
VQIAWLFNLRGADIAFNPVFFSYALVTRSEAVLYVDPTQLQAAGNAQALQAHWGTPVTVKVHTRVSYGASLSLSLSRSLIICYLPAFLCVCGLLDSAVHRDLG